MSSKTVETVVYEYKIPWKGRLAIFIANHLPDMVRASVAEDFLYWLNDECTPVHEIDDETKYETYHHTISQIRLETLRRKIIVNELGGVKVEKRIG